jgi:hypothetical protein
MKLQDFTARLADLEALRKLQARALTRIVLVVHGGTQQDAPVRSGHLRRTLTHRVEANASRGVIGTNARYARTVHEGSKPRVILPKSPTGVLVFTIGGKKIFARHVRHPGTKANPFMTRGLEKSRDRIQLELAGAGQAYLESLVR